ncbi:phosphoglycerate mutase [Candidatus Pacearchaeota archaeon]|nr:phosphoglycerate mutase [Candidatus Pacearchaeota archaeon]|tara:strand:- start:33 stop:1271 length:1239 start_codon:yes stop_codon:yes gene_type:complete
MKKILVILDGMSGLPLKEFGGKTVLERAEIPNLDFFAENGKMGYMYPLGEKIIPSSDNALVGIFGNDAGECKRGYYEALGVGFKIARGDLALRTNFATVDNLKSKKIIDRRAGRNLSSKEAGELAEAVNMEVKLPCKFEFKASVQHRGVLVLRGGFSDNISSVNSGWKGGRDAMMFKFSEPMDNDPVSKYTANIVNDFISQSHKILDGHEVNVKREDKGLLKANVLLTRGASAEIPKIKGYGSWMSINAMPLEMGIAKASRMKNFAYSIPDMRGRDIYKHFYKLLKKKSGFCVKTLKRSHRDFLGCYVHFKEMDNAGHDDRPLDKKKMIELVDRRFFGKLRRMVRRYGWKVVVSCDHSTPCKLKGHSVDPVPVLVYDGENNDESKGFDEKEMMKGSLGKMYGKEFMKRTGLG